MWLLLTPLVLFTTSEILSQTRTESSSDSAKVRPALSTSDFFSSSGRQKGAFEINSSETDQSKAPTAPLSLFGFDLFQEKMQGVARTADAMTLPSNYRLGAGDRIGIYLLGTVQENLDVMVNVEGKIFLPPVGVIEVAGKSMDEFKALLTRELSQFYDNFNLDIMLLQPKDVMVAVVGDVNRPGKYVLSALNTVLDAVIRAGGPGETGSIRDIRLIRDGETFTSVDLYRFLMTGENREDEYLQAGDRVFVPVARRKVTIDGEVHRPAIFELKPDSPERLSDLVELAGGFTEFAYLDKIEISRLHEDGYRHLTYVDFNAIATGDSLQDLRLHNEDHIHIYSKLEQIHDRRVAIFGEVRKPGNYVLEDNMRLSGLILKAGNLTRKAYTVEAEIAKIDPGKPTRFLKVSLEGLAAASHGHNGYPANGAGDVASTTIQTDVLLEEDDQVFVRQIPEWDVGLTVDVQGEVMFPGRYPIVKDSTYLSEILQKAGGFTDEAFVQEAFVMRSSTRLRFDKEFERLKEMRREEMSDLEYQYFVMRQNSADIDQIVVDFEKLVAQNDRTQDIILENGDVIVVPKEPKVVSVTGSVANAGGVTYVPNANLTYYLAKAGGASWDANLGKTKVIKVTGEVIDDEDVKTFEAGDIIWVPRKSDKKFWPVALQTVSVLAQLASIYLIVDTAINR